MMGPVTPGITLDSLIHEAIHSPGGHTRDGVNYCPILLLLVDQRH